LAVAVLAVGCGAGGKQMTVECVTTGMAMQTVAPATGYLSCGSTVYEFVISLRKLCPAPAVVSPRSEQCANCACPQYNYPSDKPLPAVCDGC
jgi:hypothetical protein